MTQSTTAMRTYRSGEGWGRSSPGSSPGAGSTAVAVGAATSVAPPSCSSMSLTAAAPLLLGRDQVHEGEDHDPDHVDEVPVQRGDFDLLGVGLGEPTLGREG